MKKKLLVLGMALICIFSMTACGAAATETVDYGITEDAAIQYADSVVESMIGIVGAGVQAQYEDDAVVSAALTSWEGAQEDIGEVLSTGSHEVIMDKDGVTIHVTIDGSEHDAVVEILMDEELVLTGVTTNVQYSFKELMVNAGLNTILGMGVVFTVLILICLIIYCFNFIPKIQAVFSRDKKEAAPKAAPAPAPVVAAPVVEELVDDYELVAVIAAAIAASEGAASTDGFVVRSIRRSSKWKSNY